MTDPTPTAPAPEAPPRRRIVLSGPEREMLWRLERTFRAGINDIVASRGGDPEATWAFGRDDGGRLVELVEVPAPGESTPTPEATKGEGSNGHTEVEPGVPSVQR